MCDERKGRESACVKRRKEKGREDSDPNGIGLYVLREVDIIVESSTTNDNDKLPMGLRGSL